MNNSFYFLSRCHDSPEGHPLLPVLWLVPGNDPRLGSRSAVPRPEIDRVEVGAILFALGGPVFTATVRFIEELRARLQLDTRKLSPVAFEVNVTTNHEIRHSE